MEIYIVDAFTDQKFMGNQAGVALLGESEDFPSEKFMQNLAAELKHSETVYVKRRSDTAFRLRYFTLAGEVDLCGHATISAFTVLREQGCIAPGIFQAQTRAGNLSIQVKESSVWMDMAAPRKLYDFAQPEYKDLYHAFGLDISAAADTLTPAIVNTGLSDILLPVKSRELLNSAQMDCQKVCLLSQKYNVIGIHMFCPVRTEDTIAFCRNFAPLYGIEEEAATGTSSGALAFYLRDHKLITDNTVCTFLQGEAMGRPSKLHAIISGSQIQIGGSAVISLECGLFMPAS